MSSIKEKLEQRLSAINFVEDELAKARAFLNDPNAANKGVELVVGEGTHPFKFLLCSDYPEIEEMVREDIRRLEIQLKELQEATQITDLIGDL